MINSFGILLFRYSIKKKRWKVLIVEKKHTYYLYEYLHRTDLDSIRKSKITKLLNDEDIKYINRKKCEECLDYNKNVKSLWEIPKGRSRHREHSIFTAIREFKEET